MFKYIIATFEDGSKIILVFSGLLNHSEIAFENFGSIENPIYEYSNFPTLNAGFIEIENGEYETNTGNSKSLKVSKGKDDHILLKKHLTKDKINTLIFEQLILKFKC